MILEVQLMFQGLVKGDRITEVHVWNHCDVVDINRTRSFRIIKEIKRPTQNMTPCRKDPYNLPPGVSPLPPGFRSLLILNELTITIQISHLKMESCHIMM